MTHHFLSPMSQPSSSSPSGLLFLISVMLPCGLSRIHVFMIATSHARPAQCFWVGMPLSLTSRKVRSKNWLLALLDGPHCCSLVPHLVSKDNSLWRVNGRREGVIERFNYELKSCKADHSLQHEMSSLARGMGSWVRIPLKAWMSLCVYCVFRGWSLVQWVLPTVLRLWNWSETKRFADILCSKWAQQEDR
jgi:hypothetical protein